MDAKDFEKAKSQVVKLCKDIMAVDMASILEQQGKNQMVKEDRSRNNQLLESCFYAIHQAQRNIPKEMPKLKEEEKSGVKNPVAKK